jgi:mannose-6-phosphate isomerase-like protein (cupin superfamily)
MTQPHLSFHTSVLLRSEQTDGHGALVENVVPAHCEGPPLHHHQFDEGFYVLDGELTVQVHDRIQTVKAAEFAFAPRGSHHCLANLSAQAARYLLVCTPAGFERYFDRIAADQAGVAPPPEAAGQIPHTTIVGPPIAQQPRPLN